MESKALKQHTCILESRAQIKQMKGLEEVINLCYSLATLPKFGLIEDIFVLCQSSVVLI